MPRKFISVLVLAIILSACAPALTPTLTPVPTGTPTPTCGSSLPGSGGGRSYEYKTCADGQYPSCVGQTEANSQNKSACLYKITCNKYYWPSSH